MQIVLPEKLKGTREKEKKHIAAIIIDTRQNIRSNECNVQPQDAKIRQKIHYFKSMTEYCILNQKSGSRHLEFSGVRHS